MSKSFDRVRGYIYPRSMNLEARDNKHASNAILGMLGVMFGIVLIAHAIMLIAG